MSIRILLAPLFGDGADEVTLAAALDLGSRLGAHVEATFVRLDPLDTVPVIGEGVSPSVIQQLTEAAEVEMNRRRDQARNHFESATTEAGVAVVDRPAGPSGVSARWRELTGRRTELLPALASTSDLVVFGRGSPDSLDELGTAIEATLLGSGRPVLIVPAVTPTGIGRKVAIAWNGRAEAARAVAGALPLLAIAEQVEVLTADTRRTDFEVSQGLVDYLASHGITATRQVVDPEEEAVGAALLRVAKEGGADLMVMGGYGRTRFSELVLGGVTRHALGHAELAVLMAH